MAEHLFWERLRSVLKATPELGLEWCERVEPRRFNLDRTDPIVTGWIRMNDPGDGTIKDVPFTLHIESQPIFREQVDWENLIPVDGLAGDCWFEGEALHLRLK